MISRIVIRNFQRHRELRVDLSPTVTTICGDSNAGKSSIRRALFWLAFNRPAGDGFVSWNQDECQISVKVDDQSIKRKRSKNLNQYFIGKQQLDHVGTGVPQAVVNLLNLDHLNFQVQIPSHSFPRCDPAFWFSLTPGACAAELNGIVNLGLIDRTLSNLASDFRKVRAEIGVIEERLRDTEKKADALVWTERADVDLKMIEEIQQRIDAKASTIDRVERSVLDWGKASTEALNAGERERRGKEAILAMDRALRGHDEIKRLQSLVEQLEQAEQDAAVMIPDLTKLESLLSKIGERKRKIGSLESLVAKIEEADAETREASEWMERANARLLELTSDGCPLCGK
jgi:DNA repair exonuclease SbcCD ATPase subunit